MNTQDFKVAVTTEGMVHISTTRALDNGLLSGGFFGCGVQFRVEPYHDVMLWESLDAAHELVTLTKGFGRKIRAYNV